MAVNEYEIQIKDVNGAFSASSNCNGTDSTIVSQRYCDVPMLHLRQSQYGLVLNSPVIAKIKARNPINWSDYSGETTSFGTISTEPRQPPNAPQEGANTDDTQIHVQWQALTGDDTGGESITFYEVSWDMGNGGSSFSLLKLEPAGSFTYTYTQSSGINPGQDYQFKYRAYNKHGIGGYSAIATIEASTVPNQLAAASTTNSSSNVIVSWSATSSDRGSAVTEYLIKFKASNNTYIEDDLNCNGKSPSIISARSCTVPLSVFTASPYSLSSGNLIVVQVQAKNGKGYSTASPDNTSGVSVP